MAGQDSDSAAGRLKVFISYSRKDVDFADDLELFLDTRGFDPVIDRHDIDHNDDWQSRLYELIHGCDVVVFVLTETSAASGICKWEVEEAAKLGKRRLVVTPGPLPDGVKPPEALGKANWVHCWRNPAVPDSSLAAGKKQLEKALRADVGWLRERTRLMEQASLWTARGATPDSPHLLRGDVLADALAWARRTPKDETLPDSVAQFLSASESNEARIRAETEAGLAEKETALATAARQSRRVRRVSMIGGALAAVLLAVAVAAGWFAVQVREDANRFQAEADANLKRAAEQEEEAKRNLAEANAQRDLARQKSAEADASFAEAELQTQLAAANLSEAERQGYLAAQGLSNQIAQQADELTKSGVHEGALLMALYADPAARKNVAAQKLSGGTGYRFARASLTVAASNMRLQKTLKGHDGWVYAAAFSTDGRFIVTGPGDKTARIWDAATGKEIRRLEGHGGSVLAAAFSTDGRFIVTGSRDTTARIWDAATGKEIRRLEGHDDSVLAAAFSTDGRFIVTGSGDKTARIWDAATGKEIRRLEGHGGSVLAAAFSTDGRFIVTGSGDKTARIWDVAEIIRAPARRQVELACNRLWNANAPLAFSATEAVLYSALQGEPVDPADPTMLVSPCRGVLPDAAFAKAG
jgi:hypothetical protein